MKLYSLSLRAIGPFADEHHVDFEALGRSGLFLLEGPTGAGKSTLIDAIVFALYGQLAGQGSSKERLHSHHAAAGVEPFVELIFEVESGVYRVRRTPSFERPKKRGTGSTTVNESVVLTRLTDIDRPDEGVTVSTRAQEAGDEIARMVGLRRDQFLQTVVLPQGEFATFLQSSGEDRKKLLQTIFRTDLYERITAELVDRRKAAAARTETARQAVTAATAVFRSVSELSDDDPLDPVAVVAEASEREREQETVASDARATLDGAGVALREAEELRRAIVRRADLVRRRQTHAQRADEVRQAADRVDVSRRAAQAMPYVAAERAAVAAHDDAVLAHERAVAALPADLDPTSLDHAAAVRSIDDVSGRIDRLGELIDVEAQLAPREEHLNAVEGECTDLRHRVDEVEERRATRPLRRADLAERVQALAERLSTRGALEARAQAAHEKLRAARKVAELTDKVEQSRSLVKRLAGDATTAEHVRSELHVARIRGIAGELAEQLVVGEACVVCGSDSHPHPAQRHADHPEPDAIERADARVQSITAALTEARAALDVDTQQIEFWRDQAGGAGVDAAMAAHAAAVAEVDQLREVAEQESKLTDQLEALDAEASRDEELRAELTERLAVLTERLTTGRSALIADRERIAQELTEGTTTLHDAVTDLKQYRDSIRRFDAARAAVTAAHERLAEARQVLVEVLTAHEFTDVDEVERTTLPMAELERLEHTIEAHRGEAARIAEGLAEPDVAALTGDEIMPDLDDLQDRRAAAADAHEAAVGLHNLARRRRHQITEALTGLREAEAALDAAGADARAVTRLAGLADASSPQNLKKLTLGTYVLLRRFADVVEAANRRLTPMSDGRYRLQVSDQRERSSGGRRTGLALAVVDTDTGRAREPRTLSGGETFYVSLCLALGLADVVTAESGGVQLGTLFVDEGFGALDAQTLDDVMGQISTLARGGRTVGLVSHVEDLKQRIADRITVTRTADGSSTLSVLAG